MYVYILMGNSIYFYCDHLHPLSQSVYSSFGVKLQLLELKAFGTWKFQQMEMQFYSGKKMPKFCFCFLGLKILHRKLTTEEGNTDFGTLNPKNADFGTTSFDYTIHHVIRDI